MTDYAKHIALVRVAQTHFSGEMHEALTAAIDLMRAATPRSAAEERAHLTALALEWANNPSDGFAVSYAILDRVSAAARAEGYAQRKAEDAEWISQQFNEMSDARICVQTELSAAQAEIKRLRESLSEAEHFASYTVNAELLAENLSKGTEIERLHEENAQQFANGRVAGHAFGIQHGASVIEELRAVRTELSNLRTAAEIAYDQTLDHALGLAIEASR